MLKSITNWMKRRDESAKTAAAEYSTLINRLVTKDDLKPAEVDRLNALHSGYSTDPLETTVAELAEAAELVTDVAGIAKVEGELRDAVKAIDDHDAETFRVLEEHIATIHKREEQAAIFSNRAEAATTELAVLERSERRLHDLQAKLWSAMGMSAPPKPLKAVRSVKELTAAYDAGIEALQGFQKWLQETPLADVRLSPLAVDVLAPWKPQAKVVADRRMEHLRDRKRNASLAMNDAIEAAKPKPPPVDPLAVVQDPISILSPENRIVEYGMPDYSKQEKPQIVMDPISTASRENVEHAPMPA